jgi:hypothetical protein
MRITYSKKYRGKVLDAFGFGVEDGRIVDKKTGKPAVDNLGAEISKKKFSGFRKGSLDIIGSDTPSLAQLRKNISGR